MDEQRIATLGKGKSVSTAKAYPLKGILEHPEPEQYYPDLANKIKVKFYESQDENEGGSIQNHSDGTYTTRINEKFREKDSDRLFLLTHETQHVIQGKDRGFRSFPKKDNALGGITSSYLYKLLKRGKLKICREGSDKGIKYRHLPDAKLMRWAWKLYELGTEKRVPPQFVYNSVRSTRRYSRSVFLLMDLKI